MMNEMKIFNNPEFGEIRTVVIDGEPWFCGKDVARNLGYANEKNAVKRHCDEGEVSKQTLGVQTGMKKDGTPAIMNTELLFVNESGLYSLIFGSKLESAKKFKKWVTSEVLPQIRKTGSYGQPQLPQTTMELLELHYKALKEVDGKVNALSDGLSTVRKDLEEFKNDLPILGIEETKISNAVKRKGVECLGGKESSAYNDRCLRQKLYSDLHRQLRREFGVSTYKAIKRSQTDTALSIIRSYKPPIVIADQIEQANAQMNLSDMA